MTDDLATLRAECEQAHGHAVCWRRLCAQAMEGHAEANKQLDAARARAEALENGLRDALSLPTGHGCRACPEIRERLAELLAAPATAEKAHCQHCGAELVAASVMGTHGLCEQCVPGGFKLAAPPATGGSA